MKIEIFSQANNEGFKVLFLDGDPVTVAKIKTFSIALLIGMGYRFEEIKIEKGSDLLFFNIASSTDDQLKFNDLFNSLNEATKNIKRDN